MPGTNGRDFKILQSRVYGLNINVGRPVQIGMGVTNLDPSRRKYESRVQCRAGDRSEHRNRDGLRPNLHLLARDEQ